MDAQVTEKSDVGGVEGPEAMYVKLIASDGHEFIMKRDHALTSGTIKNMLSGPGRYFLVRKYHGSVLMNEKFRFLYKAHHNVIAGLALGGLHVTYTVISVMIVFYLLFDRSIC